MVSPQAITIFSKPSQKIINLSPNVFNVPPNLLACRCKYFLFLEIFSPSSHFPIRRRTFQPTTILSNLVLSFPHNAMLSSPSLYFPTTHKTLHFLTDSFDILLCHQIFRVLAEPLNILLKYLSQSPKFSRSFSYSPNYLHRQSP